MEDLAKNSHLFWKQVNAGKLPTCRSNVVLIVLHSIESSAHILNYIRQYNNSLQLVCLSSGRASQASQRCRSLFTATEMQPRLVHLCEFGSAQQHRTNVHPETLAREQRSWTWGSKRFLCPACPKFNIQGTGKTKSDCLSKDYREATALCFILR